jgi:hypothetical protein
MTLTNRPRPGRQQMIQAPPAGAVTVELAHEPDDDILLLGLMLADTRVIFDQLQGLPFDADEYRGSLRVVREATKRILKRCNTLIGDDGGPNE